MTASENTKNSFLKTRNILNYVMLASIFLEAFSFDLNTPFEFRLAHIVTAVCGFLFFCLLLNTKTIDLHEPFSKTANKTLLTSGIIVGFLLLVSVGNYLIRSHDLDLFYKQFFGILLYGVSFYALLKMNQNNIKGLFSTYINLVFIIAIIGLIQEIGYLFRIDVLYFYTYFLPKWRLTYAASEVFIRVNSILPEPTSFCLVIFVAFFASINSFFSKGMRLLSKTKAIVIIIAYVLSFSFVGYIGIFFSIFYLFLKSIKTRKKTIFLFIVLVCVFCSFFTIRDLRQRIQDTFDIFSNRAEIIDTNISTMTFYINFQIVKKTTTEDMGGFFFGRGLGSYEQLYWENIKKLDIDLMYLPLLNSSDANSLFLRLFAETGLCGLGIFFWFLYCNFLPKHKDKQGYFWIMNNGILILILLRLLRQGNYFSEGFFFFIVLYFFTCRAGKSDSKNYSNRKKET